MLNIVFLERSSTTKIYPCGGVYIYIDVPLEEALFTEGSSIARTRHFRTVKKGDTCVELK